ncbi:MAG: tetratricopeptide repeat protein [Casimicrobiaceae bacterium]
MNFSIRGLFNRGGADSAPGDDRQRAQKLVDRGNAAEESDALAEAIRCYREAIKADPGFAPAHLNVGIALQALGESAQAIASYSAALALDPDYAAAQYNLGLAHLTRHEYSQAETGFREALRLRNEFPEAWVGLADVMEARGDNDSALSALESAIGQRSDYAGALMNAALLLRKMGQLEAAAAYYERVLALQPADHRAHYELGTTQQDLGALAEAESSYRHALLLHPDFVEAQTNLALILRRNGNKSAAIQLLFDAVSKQPANAQPRRILADALQGTVVTGIGDRERKVLASLCVDDDISMRSLESAIIGWLKTTDAFEYLQESARRGQDPFAPIAPTVRALLHDPLLLAALPRMTLFDADLEQILAHLRRHILLRQAPQAQAAASDPGVALEFICALSRQCFFSGYAFFAESDELLRLEVIREAVEIDLREPATTVASLEARLATIALYDYLYSLQDCERLLTQPKAGWSSAFGPIIQEQLENRKSERQIAGQLTALTPIVEEGSVAVREMYEQNPYPRWVSVQHPGSETIEDLALRLCPGQEIRVRSRPMKILVAGCGTGHHPIQLARRYPHSEILAVDLSVASLAYAARMTDRLGISNINYRHGDILELGELKERFEMVQSCGVLHHMNDPMRGWQVLVDLLEPDGLMLIALYSEKARSGIVAAREFIKSLDLPQTPEGIRRGRHAILGLPTGHLARGALAFADFYTLDGCRDLIMHVREHRFTLPRIADHLERLGLQFLAFESTAETRLRFQEMFPGSDHDADLDAWDRFEDAYPETFTAMYTFWCRKKQDVKAQSFE